LAKSKKLEFFDGNPQDNYPDVLPKFIAEMQEYGWDRGQDDEELFNFAMFDKQYRDFKSGEAKKRFNAELQKEIEKKYTTAGASVPAVNLTDLAISRHPNAEPINATANGRVLWELDFEGISLKPENGKKFKDSDLIAALQTTNGLEFIYANYNGKIVDAVEQGKVVKKGDVIGYMEK
jgi:pyruvate carboxylase subunit B